MDTKFIKWLTDELNRRQMSMRENAERGGPSHATVSNVLQGKTPVTRDFCVAVAIAFDMDPRVVMHKAGHWKKDPVATDRMSLRELWAIVSQMSDDELDEVENYARFLIQQKRARAQANIELVDN